MRILFAVPHYFARDAAGSYGSERTAAAARARIVRTSLASLRQTFSHTQALIDGRHQRFHPANPQLAATVRIVLCTTGDQHLLADLAGCNAEHVATGAPPRHLGFECHKVLQDGLGDYDYFGYLEDDLRLADALFFHKLAWFNERFGDGLVLQPNRFRLTADPDPYKLYIDGNPHTGLGAPREAGATSGASRPWRLAGRSPFSVSKTRIPGVFFCRRRSLRGGRASPISANPTPPLAAPSKAPRRSASCAISASTSRPAKTPPFSRSSISTRAISAAAFVRLRVTRRCCLGADLRAGGAAAPCRRRRVVTTRSRNPNRE